MKIDELRAKAKEVGDKIDALAKDYEANGQKWKDDETRAAFNTATDERRSLEADLQAEVDAEGETSRVRGVLQGMQAFDERTLTRVIPGREDGKFGSKQVSEEQRCMALAGWVLGEERTERHAEAMQACGISGVRGLQINGWKTQQFNDARRVLRNVRHEFIKEALEETRSLSGIGTWGQSRFSRAAEEERALSSQIGALGGLTVAPDQLIRSLEINMVAFGGVRQVAETMTTTSGERMTWPTADDTSNTGEQLGENTSIGSSVDPSFGSVYWDAYKFSSKPILVPYELLEDSVFNLPSILGEMLGERLGRITATRHTTGTGANTCKGIVTGSTAGKTTAVATAISPDEVQDLIHSIDPAYRTGSSFMMHDGVWLYLKKLKDGVARYYIQEDITGTAVPRMFGYPVFISQEMQSTVATGTKTMLFGQLFKHKIRRVNGIRLYRLQERYRDTDQDAFIAFLREDSNTLNAGTVPIKHMLQA